MSPEYSHRFRGSKINMRPILFRVAVLREAKRGAGLSGGSTARTRNLISACTEPATRSGITFGTVQRAHTADRRSPNFAPTKLNGGPTLWKRVVVFRPGCKARPLFFAQSLLTESPLAWVEIVQHVHKTFCRVGKRKLNHR